MRNDGWNKSQFDEVVTEWQRQLLQMDRRNNLLFFRHSKTAVRIVEHTPDGIVEELLASRRGLIFDYAEPRSRIRIDQFPEVSSKEEQEPEPYIILGDLRGDCPPLELQRRLGNLRRKAREWEEEQGLNILFLALGFLHWVDEDGEKAIAPLLLLPCRLDRASPRDAFTLLQSEDDLTTNSTLIVKLAEFGIILPEGDTETKTAGEYIDAVRGLIKQRPEWEVQEDVYLANFAYSKLAMWRDLEIIKNNGTDHPVILTLAGGKPTIERDSTPSAHPFSVPDDLTGARLDDVLDVRDQFAVLPADYSQLLAIARAKSGLNLVVHGPPGTGKSQTIANIIATFLAEGKSVLFVSEKTAALDVVKRRLDEKQLGVFCLDLHSERGSKVNVYHQLQQSVDDRRAVRRLEFDYTALEERRSHLNNVVRALHQIRRPLNRTVFQVQGRFATIRGMPHIPFEVNQIDELDQARLAAIIEVADQVRLRRREFREHWTNHWRVLKYGTPSLELANKIRGDMHTLSNAVTIIQSAAPDFAEALGLLPPRTINEITKLIELAKHLAKAPGVPHEWLQEGVSGRLRMIAEQEAGFQSARTGLITQLRNTFGNPVPDWNYAGLMEQLSVGPEKERLLKTLLGDKWQQRIIQTGQITSGSLRQLSGRITQLRSIGADIADFLQVKEVETWKALNAFLQITRTLERVGLVPPKWVELQGTESTVAILGRTRKVVEDLEAREKLLFSEFEPGVVEVADNDMLIRYRTDHQSRLRRLIASSYRSDRKAIQAYRHASGKMSFFRELQVVEDILELRKQRRAWEEAESELTPALGIRYAGRKTNWDAILRDIRDVQGLLDGSGSNRTRMAQLLTEENFSRRSHELSEMLEQISAEAQTLLDSYLTADLVKRVQEDEMTFPSLEQLIRDAIETAECIEHVAEIPVASACQEIRDLHTLCELMSSGAKLRALEQEHFKTKERLQADFQARFKGFDTDWSDILACLKWVEELHVIIPPTELTPDLSSRVEQPSAHLVYERIAKSASDILSRFIAQTDTLMKDYDLQVGPWDSWEEAKFDITIQWSEELLKDADSASDWLLYEGAVSNLDKVIGPTTMERIRREIDDSELVPRVVERRVLGAWLDWIYQQEPLLSKFAASEQEDIITKFKDLDMQLTIAAQNEVRKSVYERYPNVYANPVRTNELGILRGELSKRRRQWPVRKLFGTIPRLIKALKPCFFVSPLAVSQYLPLSKNASETLNFDVVIFDEASQVFPEDAVPAILRGKQTILAGDLKQLPPSSFWRSSLSEDEPDSDNEDDDVLANQFTGRDSILDAAVGWVGRLFSEAYLNVHYRSKDESLIRFSNHHFYEDRLLTFPCPGIGDAWYGIHDVFVADGRYDAGATRSNRKEADRVVDIIFEHMRTRPVGESLGVVAMSRPQADLIERLVEERRILERDVEERFKERPDEPFFVKNLENVQGDERDHMIISIGYGPTVESGAVPNRFGPLNIAGGERRLNVVISRARQRVDLVHSLRASDIRSQQRGAIFLRLYLEYAANPYHAFEAQTATDLTAESESPFEAAVEHALIAKGHRVARQVGVAGYRIDLAILSEDGTKHDLGIECDGWTYHNTPTARDRDWLRQQVLEGLGWKLHRVWSTAWVRNPEAELIRIEAALAAARVQVFSVQNTPKAAPHIDVLSTGMGTVDSDPLTIEIAPLSSQEIYLEEYQKANLPSPGRLAELRYETSRTLVSIITRIAEEEGPVHKDIVIERIRLCYRMGHVRSSTRDNVEKAIRVACTSGAVRNTGDFIWLREDQLCRTPRLPVDGNIEHIPPTELKAVIVAVARTMFGIPRNDLTVEVTRSLRFNRTGGRITEVLDNMIQNLLDEGELIESFGMIHTPEIESKGDFNNGHRLTAEAKERIGQPETDVPPTTTSLIQRLRSRGLEVIDKRPSGGSLWVVGGRELKPLLQQFEEQGVRFAFAPGGGQTTKKRPAWWTRGQA